MPRTPQLVLDLDGRPGTVRTARREVEHFLDRCADRAVLRPDTRADVGLVVAELLANACVHAPGPCRLTVRLSGARVAVAVRDTSPLLPVVSGVPGSPDPGGYGLLVVTRLCTDVRAVRVRGGKVVRAVVVQR
ncbi:ATP-binding protein [Kitasatospora terrestris]|uniref:Histidine kinase/HSP90-like ATPase domain-containing protein n=1 Tax=Kitasatospora terrestris TaxID=258051 RepID=A0ABP9EPW4_9ACTN